MIDRVNSNYFNTSHVTVYQICRDCRVWNTGISIHLMLLFIDNDFVNVISVFHISIHLMLLFINVAKFEISPAPHFNTSHVTVYQGFHKTLHHLSIISIHLMLLFIFNTEAKERIGMINFNTSHVTVYPVWFNIFVPPVYYFNTSHVTVYHSCKL